MKEKAKRMNDRYAITMQMLVSLSVPLLAVQCAVATPTRRVQPWLDYVLCRGEITAFYHISALPG